MAALRAIGFGAALGLTAAVPATAQAVVDLYGVEAATLEWAPAPGAVAGYYVIVSRNGGTPSLYGVSSDNREAVTSSIGDVITVQVAAFDAAGLAGPMSTPSDALRFNPLTSPPSDGDGDTPPPDPEDGDGGSGGGDSGSGGGDGTPEVPGDTPDETPVAGPARNDFTGDGRPDLLLRDPKSGELELWTLDETQVVRRSSLPHLPYPWYLEDRGDYDGDGQADLLWRHKESGALTVWLVRAGEVHSGAALTIDGVKLSRSWKIGGSADFDGDGRDDLVLIRPTGGALEILSMDGARVAARISSSAPSTDWRIAATPDADGDGIAELLWQHLDTHALALEWMSAPRNTTPLAVATSRWRVLGSADLDGDGRDDLWMQNRDTKGVQPWFLTGATVVQPSWSTRPGDKYWEFRGLGDFDADGLMDSFWHHPDGFVEIWFTGPTGVEPAFVSEQTASDKVIGDAGD